MTLPKTICIKKKVRDGDYESGTRYEQDWHLVTKQTLPFAF